MKYKVIIVSDIHLGTKNSRVEDFIKFIHDHPTELLILNGDIIDGWALSRGSKWKKKHTKVISLLLKLSHTTKIIWIRGNHDEFLKEFVGTRFGNIEIREDYIIEITDWEIDDIYNTRKYYVFHGDVIDIFITKYKWLSKIGSIGYDLALWLNRVYNNYRSLRGKSYLSISQKIKQGVKTATNYINDFETTALKIAQKNGCNGVICGHIHQPANYISDKGHYLNSGDWVENKTAILITKNNKIEVYEHNR